MVEDNMLNLTLLVSVISRMIIFVLTDRKINILIQLSLPWSKFYMHLQKMQANFFIKHGKFRDHAWKNFVKLTGNL